MGSDMKGQIVLKGDGETVQTILDAVKLLFGDKGVTIVTKDPEYYDPSDRDFW